MEPKYEEHFTAYLDFLGFSEASTNINDATRLKVLDLLLSLSPLRGDYNIEHSQNSSTFAIKPAISTFSDHIVISYPLRPVIAQFGQSEPLAAFVIMNEFTWRLAAIATAALRIGFLVRGGATVGNLYHAGGVVFGEALVEAFYLESRTSVYPRVILSQNITGRQSWTELPRQIAKDNDGLYHVDYITIALQAATLTADCKVWLADVFAVICANLRELKSKGKLAELAKWTWFANHVRAALESATPETLELLGLSLEAIPWS